MCPRQLQAQAQKSDNRDSNSGVYFSFCGRIFSVGNRPRRLFGGVFCLRKVVRTCRKLCRLDNRTEYELVTVSRAAGEGSYIEIDSSSVAAGAFSCAVLAEDEFRRLSGGGVDVNALAVIGLSGLTEKTVFKAYPVRGCSVSVQFYNDLVSCGINSVMHTLFYCLQFTAEVAHGFSVRQFYFDFSVPVVQSIIYGTIPEIYVR